MSLAMFVLIPLFIRERGGSEVTIGLVLGCGTTVSVLARPLVGWLLDRVGRRRVLLWAAGLNALSFLPFIGVTTVGPALYLFTALHDLMWGTLFAAYFTYASDLSPPARRAEGIAVFGVAGMITNGLGPALGEEILRRAGWTPFFLVAASFALVSLGLTTLVPRRPAVAVSPASPSHGARATARLVAAAGLGRLLAATALFGAGINAAFLFVAPFTRDLGLERAGPFFLAYAGTSIVLRLVGRRLPDRIGVQRVAAPAFAVFAAGLASICLLPRPGLLVLAGITCGAGHGSLFPVLGALAMQRTPPALSGTVMSLVTAVLDFGGVIGIPLCGAVAEVAGYRAMFALMAAANVAGMALMVGDRRPRVG